MSWYDKVDVSERIDANKTDSIHGINFKFQPKSQNLTQKTMTFDRGAIVTVKGNYYSIYF